MRMIRQARQGLPIPALLRQRLRQQMARGRRRLHTACVTPVAPSSATTTGQRLPLLHQGMDLKVTVEQNPQISRRRPVVKQQQQSEQSRSSAGS